MSTQPEPYRPHIDTRGPYVDGVFSTDCSCGLRFPGADQHEADVAQQEHAAARRSDALAAGIDSALVDALDRAPRVLDRYKTLLDLGIGKREQVASLIVDLLHYADWLPTETAADTLALAAHHYDDDRQRIDPEPAAYSLLPAAMNA